MYKSVEFISRKEAETRAGHHQYALISLWDEHMGPPELQTGWQSVISVPFGSLLDPLNKTQFDQIAEFCDHMYPVCRGMVVHCFKGECRSAAIARWIALRYTVEDFDYDYDGYDSLLFRLFCKFHPIEKP